MKICLESNNSKGTHWGFHRGWGGVFGGWITGLRPITVNLYLTGLEGEIYWNCMLGLKNCLQNWLWAHNLEL